MKKVSPQIKLSNFYSKKRVIVTGGLGFIGSNLAARLVSYGAKVTIIDAKITYTGSNPFNIRHIKNKVKFVQANVASKKIIPIIKKSEYIFNLAGVLSHVDAMKDPLKDLKLNTNDQLAFLINIQRSNPDVKIIYTGTRNQYGRIKNNPVAEDAPQIPIDTNGVSEIACEMYHQQFWLHHGLKSTSLRLCNVFGPRHQMRHSRQGVLNWFIKQAMDNEPITLMGGGKQIRDCVYVEDLVDALLLLPLNNKVWGESFNIGAFPVSLNEFSKQIVSILKQGKIVKIPFPNDRKTIEPGSYIANYQKLTKYTGWKPKWNLETALAETISYYEKNKKHYW